MQDVGVGGIYSVGGGNKYICVMKKILLLIILLGYNQEYGGVYSSTSSNQLLLAENSVWQPRKQTGTATVIKSTKKQSKVLDAYGELFLKKRNQ